MPDDVRALTIHQPWASLVAAGVKTIETRSWRTDWRGTLLIHAGAHRPPVVDFGRWSVPPVIDAMCEWNPDGTLAARHPLPLGAVVAVAHLDGVVPIVCYGDPIRGQRPVTATAAVRCADGITDFILVRNEDEAADALRVHGPVPADIDRSDQLPFGDFTPGRYAWLLSDVRPLPQPVPAKGRQGLWRPDPDLLDAVEALT